ncbi:MAG TPA: efflux RND transporter permease subunit [Candidatus Sulfopaludibacter sp.]|jgi:multidrug efflux pump subunit AcrB|nr:efflux RND transporter permease subunit [Candidatus Sulfopaludibacter sp.]
MWIVQLALRRPYTFVIMALLIVILGAMAAVRMPTDIFPEINIPVVSVIWSYGGVSPEEMAEIITVRSERGFTISVNDIEHLESESLQGLGIIKVFFHPQAKVDAAVSQLSAMSGSVLHSLPTGITPPLILRYNASSVPILQLSISSDTLTEQQLYDYGYNFIRTQMATVQGATFPLPYGGRPRQVSVDLDPQALYAQGLSADDVSRAINTQSLVLPSGSVKIGAQEYTVKLNSAPQIVAAFNRLPIRQKANGATVFVGDVAHVRDGYAVQTNIVRHNGARAALLTVLKNGGSSTLDIVSRIKEILPRIRSTLPAALNLKLMFDQSIFVRAAIRGVLREATIAALLTGLMILLFLGSWRSTIVVCVSIPLSILTSLAVLNLMGETINVMTLGGLALAVGILVDDATVEIENIHRNLGQGKGILQAILDGAMQIATPAFVSTLCICIVFVPVIFLTGAARYLFEPLALAVVLAIGASYLLSRTLVPTMVRYLLAAEVERYASGEEGAIDEPAHGFFGSIHHGFQAQFENMRRGYRGLLASALAHRKLLAAGFALICLACFSLIPFLGQDFFPQVDAGQIRLHVRAPAGTRIEETERYFAAVENRIRGIIPPAELTDMLDNIGLPYSGFNIAMSDSATIGEFDGEILVSLRPGEHRSTWEYIRTLRETLNHEFPALTFFFQPADIVGQILNFGLPAPIDVQVMGPLGNAKANYAMARRIEARMARIPGAVDVHTHQVVNVPELLFNVDRTRAQQLGLSQQDVANSLLISLSSSTQIAPNYWIDPRNSVDYPVSVMTPQFRVNSTSELLRTPIHSGTRTTPQLLTNVGSLERDTTASVVNHYDVQPLYDVYANVQDRDLGSVAKDVDAVIREYTPKLAKGSFVETRGQVSTMRSSFIGLGVGLIFAVVLVYFVMVVNFQSWLDPFIILMALPGALAGIVLMLFVTQTTLNVPSLMGAIMSIGVATANSILLVNFANDLRETGADAVTAALEAGFTRLRPVVMTALAMIVGMLPMALGYGEGGEQNAPLGRAVIGGLLLATIATLFFVPVVYSVLRRNPPRYGRKAEVEL